MNFEKCFCFDGENMPNSARYYTAHKSKLLVDVSFIKKIIILKINKSGKPYQIEECPYLFFAI
jgi:hypothetical protein